jgi:hypothetical protein
VSHDDLRRLLDFPDAQLRPPTLASIVRRARRRRTRRRLTAVGALAAVVAVVALLGTASPDLTQHSIPAAPPQTPDVPGVTGGALDDGIRHAVGHGWAVTMRVDDVICWDRRLTVYKSYDPGNTVDPDHVGDSGTFVETRRICDELWKLDAGTLQVRVLRTIGGGALYTGMIPWRAPKVSLVADGARYRVDQIVKFTKVRDWILYALWLPVRDSSATVTAYDSCKKPHTKVPRGSYVGGYCFDKGAGRA